MHRFHVAFLVVFCFFFVHQTRILSYLSPDCDAAYLDLRIRLLSTFAYLVDIMNLRNKTHEFELNEKAAFPLHIHGLESTPDLTEKGGGIGDSLV